MGVKASKKGITLVHTVARSKVVILDRNAKKMGDSGGYHRGTFPYAKYRISGIGREP